MWKSESRRAVTKWIHQDQRARRVSPTRPQERTYKKPRKDPLKELIRLYRGRISALPKHYHKTGRRVSAPSDAWINSDDELKALARSYVKNVRQSKHPWASKNPRQRLEDLSELIKENLDAITETLGRRDHRGTRLFCMDQ